MTEVGKPTKSNVTTADSNITTESSKDAPVDTEIAPRRPSTVESTKRKPVSWKRDFIRYEIATILRTDIRDVDIDSNFVLLISILTQLSFAEVLCNPYRLRSWTLVP